MNFDMLLQLFKNYLLFEKCFSRNTYIAYVREIQQFSKFVDHNNFSVNNINLNAVTRFKIHLKAKDNSPRSIAKKIIVVRSFVKFLSIKFAFEEFDITIPKFGFKLPEYFSQQQISDILNELKLDNTPLGIRNNLLFAIVYSTGIRVSELINIKLSDIDLDTNLLLVTGKGNKQRYVPMPRIISNDLHAYINQARKELLPENKHCDYLFFSAQHKKPVAFSRQGIWWIFKNIGKKQNIKIYPHKFRHSIATHFLENGLNLRMIQRFLGHESILTTSIYTHLDRTHLRKFYNKFHPRS